MSNKKFAIVTACLNEQDYVNYFIECYLGVGFHHFYILIDNSTDEQLPYTFKKHFHPFINVFYMTDIFSQDTIQNILENHPHKASLVHAALQEIFLRYVTEDYCMLVGVDSLLYLNGLTVQSFFEQKGITDDVGMIFFHWYHCINNKTVESNYNLVNYIESKKCHKSGSDHFFTLCNKKHVVKPSDDSHHYIINKPVLSFYNDNLYTIEPHHNFWDISKNILHVNSNSVRPHGCILHFLVRSVNDCLLKYYYQWNKNDISIIHQKRSIINNIINTNSKDGNYYEGKLNYLFYGDSSSGHLGPSTNYEPIFLGANDALLKRMLYECNVSYETYLKWCSQFGYLS